MSIANSSGESLFNRAVRRSLTGPLTSGQIAELLVSDGGAVDPVHLNDAKARLEGYRQSGLLEFYVRLPLTFVSSPSWRSAKSRLDDYYESLRYGHATPTGPGLQKPAATAQQYELTYSPKAAGVIAAEERKHGPLKQGFTAWAGLPDESVQQVVVQVVPVQSLMGLLKQTLVDTFKQFAFGGRVSSALESQEAPLELKDLIRRLEDEGYGDKSAMFNNLKRKPWLSQARAGERTWFLQKVLTLFVEQGVAKVYSEPAKAPRTSPLRIVNE